MYDLWIYQQKEPSGLIMVLQWMFKEKDYGLSCVIVAARFNVKHNLRSREAMETKGNSKNT